MIVPARVPSQRCDGQGRIARSALLIWILARRSSDPGKRPPSTTIEDNGLRKPWFGRLWLNPPYGGSDIVGPWMRRMVWHGIGTVLIFARTETDVWFETIWRAASLILFLEGRFFTLMGASRGPMQARPPL